jgi:hypothetical protein
MSILEALYVAAFVGVYIVALLIGAMFLEGVEARRDARGRNHARTHRVRIQRHR